MSFDSWVHSGIAVASAFSGMLAGHHLTIRNEKRKDDQKLNKIKYLLNADYTMIYRQVKEGKVFHTEGQNAIIQQNVGINYVTNLEVMQEVLVALGIRYSGFSYWESISNSGNLINLKPDELRIITSSHDTIVNIIPNYENTFGKFKIDMLEMVVNQQMSPAQKITLFKQACSIYFYVLFETYDQIIGIIESVKNNISWIDLNAEPILEFKEPEKNRVKAEAYVTPEGITVHPDGTENDRKGTVLKMGSNYKL